MSGDTASHAGNRALSGAVLPTFAYYALSSMAGLLAITTLHLINGIFVGNYVGGRALAALTLLTPCFTVLYAVALMFAVGGSVGAGKYLGAGDRVKASAVFSQSLWATFAFALLFALASHGFESALHRLLNVPSEIEPFVSEYFGVIRWVLVIQLTTMVLYYFVRADGFPLLATTALVVGSLSNVALDALFVARFGLGLRGAAYSSAISQLIQATVLASYFFRDSRTLRFVLVPTNWSHLFRATFGGAAEFVNEISVGLVFWLLNHLLLERVDVNGVAAFSVVNHFVFVSLMSSYGIGDALHLLVSQNYGAGNRTRIDHFFRVAFGASLFVGALLTLVLVGWRGTVTGWFLGDEEAAVADRAVGLVLVVWPLFLVHQANVVLSCYLTAVDRPKPSATIALLRGLVLPGSLLVALHLLFRPTEPVIRSSEWSFMAALPLAEWITFGVAFSIFRRHRPAALRLELSPANG